MGQGLGQRVPGEDQGQEVQQSRDQEVQRNQGQEVLEDQDLEVLLNLVLGVQQGQDRQAHQGQGLHELDRLEGCYTLLLFVSCGLKCPLSVKSIFDFAGSCVKFKQCCLKALGCLGNTYWGVQI